jgi:hypothetical protein
LPPCGGLFGPPRPRAPPPPDARVCSTHPTRLCIIRVRPKTEGWHRRLSDAAPWRLLYVAGLINKAQGWASGRRGDLFHGPFAFEA